MKKLQVAAVSYLNTKPLLYGILKSKLDSYLDLQLAIPSQCAQMMIDGEVDLALMPIAAIPDLKNPIIISDYGIGCDGPVRTVCLYSERPLEEITQVFLDFHSRTSVQLIQVLFRHHWKLQPEFLQASPGFESNIKGTTAGLVIGDRAIEIEDRFPYVYDLGEAWKEFTGLPFVFAAWVSLRPLPESFLQQFNEAMSLGIQHIPELMYLLPTPHSGFNLEAYFRTNITYHLDEARRKAINLFFQYLKKGPFPSLFDPKIQPQLN